jgi:hypothetical protein
MTYINRADFWLHASTNSSVVTVSPLPWAEVFGGGVQAALDGLSNLRVLQICRLGG